MNSSGGGSQLKDGKRSDTFWGAGRVSPELGEEERMEVEGIRTNVKTWIGELFRGLGSNQFIRQELLTLCYELIQIEAQVEESFLEGLLKGMVQPLIFTKVICCNRFNLENQTMEIDPSI